ETILIKPAHVIIVEGILVLAHPELRKLLDIKIFVDTDPDVRFIRRLTRDVKERGRSVQSVIDQYLNVVRLMHMEFVEPSKRFADIIVPEGGFNQVAIDIIITKIRSILNESKTSSNGGR
ncbi:MAG TPA: uridine kinase, partial [Candidatus Sumerlaeia bacterium]|nr:uridine kinase [Candidatus Sumerlaeia bacterium]